MEQFFYKTGFLFEMVDGEEKMLWDFFSGSIQLPKGIPEDIQRIIRLLNIGAKQERKEMS